MPATTTDAPSCPKCGGAIERFWSRVAKGDGCWEWTGARKPNGYGDLTIRPRRWSAHRFAYTVAVGPIPAGMVVCHTCDNPPCCNPAHLFLGTQADNMADMGRKGRRASSPRKTHCRNGHEYTPANTYMSNGGQVCRECNNSARRKVGGRGAYRTRVSA